MLGVTGGVFHSLYVQTASKHICEDYKKTAFTTEAPEKLKTS